MNRNNLQAARLMRTFNKIFCSDRITIERAFGQLVRRWGILWAALPFQKLEEISLCMRVAVKLHNLCVDEFLCRKFEYATTEGVLGTEYPVPKLPTIIAEVNGIRLDDLNDNLPDDETSIEELSTSSLLVPANGSNGRGLREDAAGLRDEEVPLPAYGDDPTINAGIAMANWLEEEANRPAVLQGQIADVNEVVTALGRNDWVLRRRQALLDRVSLRNKSAAKRLKICMQIFDEGYLFQLDGSV